MAEVSMGSSSSSTELSPEEERVLIRDIAIAAESNSKEGDTFYLITQRWWQEWIDYVNQDQPCNTNDGSSLSEHCDSAGSSTLKKPSRIDNSDLIYDAMSEDSGNAIEILDTLQEGRDYVLLPQEVWNQLHSWYGGGPTLPRRVISSGLSQTELAVEVYPLRLQLLLMPKDDRCAIRISKKETIRELHRRACEIFDLNSEHVCIWDYFGHQKYTLMNDLDKTLDDANLQMDQDILVEVLHANGTASGGRMQSVKENGFVDEDATSVLTQPSKSSLSTAGGFSYTKKTNAFRSGSIEVSLSQNQTSLDNAYGSSGVTTRGSTAGLTGLLNLGNTCFMNSAIQCLVHTPEFARYFQEDYHQEINWQNPLGMVGELALAFGDLLRKLWAPGRTPIAPRPFKAKLTRFAPQFSGYNQHDSQELLAFLLDGLHEDLNRVKHKPYIKSRDTDGRPDEEVADEFWANHIARNDSIIVDVCQGQYKSTLVCPVCNKVSVTFDPFMYLSLPLQFNTTRAMTVTIVPCDGSALPSVVTVNVPKQGRCRDLIQALAIGSSLKQSEELKLAEIRNHLIQKVFEDPLISLSTIKDDDHLAVYKVSQSSKNTVLLRLIPRRRDQKVGGSQTTAQWKPFGAPLLSSISHEDGAITKGEVRSIVRTMLSPFIREDHLVKNEISDPNISGGRSARGNNTKADNTNGAQDTDKEGGSSKVSSPKLHLQLVDENNKSIDLEGDETEVITIPTSGSVTISLDWSQELSGIYDISLFESLPEVLKYGPATKKSRTEPLSLYACLEAFLREEPLVPEDMWYCPQCKERRQASKKLDLWRLPEVLVIHLKRFSYSRSMKHKLETFVNFPIHDLDLTKYVANKTLSRPQLYELYALTNHYGGMGSGHYTAHIKLLDENKWYNFDDSHISQINEDDVKSAAAYVLFYRRVRTDAGREDKHSQ
ncbi:PREDICTED: ubiquitin carboxyl-terminal hydrolase 5 [Tarenaya hassleriana]|uniref:ubiquitin carboxyl-terminal hydrolase 5 n=1 Tax=Tarenaya hassleriana TaxID=28532 RepID=UPI00053CA815|nr:PREDICTED: ubiquitin carboxyl-terminal hydrolase 5 [Tarenaya hassleriana]